MGIKNTRRIRLAAGLAINAAGLGLLLGHLTQQLAGSLPGAL